MEFIKRLFGVGPEVRVQTCPLSDGCGLNLVLLANSVLSHEKNRLPDFILTLSIQGRNGNENEESDPVSSEKVSPGLRHKRNKQVVVARHQPLLRALPMGAHGGVQGFEWFRQSMRRDEDGDYAIEFLEESQHKVERRRSNTDVKHRRVNEMEGLCSKGSSPAGNSTTLLMKSGNITVLEE
jgi:hypothetical protein